MPANNEVRNINLFGYLLSLKQDIFDSVHPIGETYTQYPQQDPPATVYNKNGITSEWELINYDGAFFRAEGTNANPFTEKGTALNVQGDMVKSHKHYMWHEHLMDHQHYMNHQHYTGGTTGEDSPDHSHNINHGHGASGSGGCYVTNGAEGNASCLSMGGPSSWPSYQWFSNLSISVSVNDHNGNSGGASTRHTHSFGAWSGGSCYLGTDTGRDYTDGAVKWNGSQHVDRSWTDGPRTWNAQGQEVDRSWTDSNDDNSFENRPKNYTIRIWRRYR